MQAQYNASELLTKRSEVSREIKSRLIARARDFHLILDDVSLVFTVYPSLSAPHVALPSPL